MMPVFLVGRLPAMVRDNKDCVHARLDAVGVPRRHRLPSRRVTPKARRGQIA